ncbi:MAG: cytochrome P450 [Anaerolineae bacterium]
MTTLAVKILPGPKTTPVLGSLPNLIRFFRQPIALMREHRHLYGKLSGLIAPVHNGQKGQILAIGGEYNQLVLSDPKRFYARNSRVPENTAAERISTGIVYLNGERHRQQRGLMLPAFHRKAIDAYAQHMLAVTDLFLRNWREGQQINVIDEMTKLTMNVVLRTLFGIEDLQEGYKLGALLEEWLKYAGSLPVNLFPYNLPGTPVRRLVTVSEQIEQQTQRILAEKRVNLEQHTDIVSGLMRAHDEDGARLSDTEVIGNAVLLFLAGHETSANALTWTLYLLAQHPEIFQDVMDELEGLLHGAMPNVEHLNQMPLLEGVIHESLRLMPPLGFNYKKAVEPFEMGGYEFSAGTDVLLSHFMSHREPDIFPDPEVFKPHRWLNLNVGTYDYIAFNGGPRLCLGATFAMVEMKLVLATLLQRFRLACIPNSSVEVTTLFLLRAKHVPMVIHKQDRKFERVPVGGNIHELILPS